MDNRKKACFAIILASVLKANKKNKKRRWVKYWMTKKSQYSHLNLTQDMVLGNDLDDYENYFRMNEDLFEELLSLVSPYISKQDTHLRQAITPREKVAITLRFLATGRSFKCLRYSSILSSATIGEAVISTCRTLIYVLKEYIKVNKKSNYIIYLKFYM